VNKDDYKALVNIWCDTE